MPTDRPLKKYDACVYKSNLDPTEDDEDTCVYLATDVDAELNRLRTEVARLTQREQQFREWLVELRQARNTAEAERDALRQQLDAEIEAAFRDGYHWPWRS